MLHRWEHEKEQLNEGSDSIEENTGVASSVGRAVDVRSFSSHISLILGTFWFSCLAADTPYNPPRSFALLRFSFVDGPFVRCSFLCTSLFM